ncbi:MAG TPA: hypothetical protein VGS97_05105 [Actinocrinis sp.]|uniref:hypothetical protein n=1 Tax=Actinocrinis sp. TaxID=1920516 RepID=UPI002DDD2180|nr:hypothetical protein [Actinocrinis sp.]HEV2343451.1 hypothetical protein [Actinocrinis sp.]
MIRLRLHALPEDTAAVARLADVFDILDDSGDRHPRGASRLRLRSASPTPARRATPPLQHPESDPPVVFSLSAAALFIILTLIAIRFAGQSLGWALVAFLAGFFTASTGAAPAIRDFVTTLSHAIPH